MKREKRLRNRENLWCQEETDFALPALTALPVSMAHLQVTASAGRVLTGSLGTTDVLNLEGQALEGSVNF